MGNGSGPSGRFRDRGPVNVDRRNVKPGTHMAGGRDLDLGGSQHRRDEVLCRRNGPKALGRQKY